MTLSIDTVVDTHDFGVETIRCDATRASLRITGTLDGERTTVLAEVLDGHVRSGRRFLRIDVGGIPQLDDAALGVLVSVHELLLSQRGTLILTRVSPELEQQLSHSGCALFVLAPTAAELAAELAG